jgi:hypothetical protein
MTNTTSARASSGKSATARRPASSSSTGRASRASKRAGAKETQVASLGGRLIGDSNTAGQSDNQVKLKDRNEQSLLLNVTTVLNENFTDLLIILAQWMNEPPRTWNSAAIRTSSSIRPAREFRAITMMYQAGLLPIEVIYEYFLKADVIPEYVTLEMFQKMLDDAKQFPNNPDFESRKEGFPDAKTQRNDELQRDLAEIEDQPTRSNSRFEADLQDAELEHNSSRRKARPRRTSQGPAGPGRSQAGNEQGRAAASRSRPKPKPAPKG